MPSLGFPKYPQPAASGFAVPGSPPHSKAVPPIPAYRGHPGPILANIFAKPPIPKVLSPHQQWQGHLLLLRSLISCLRNGERSNSSWTSELWSKQKKIAGWKNTNRQQPSVSLTKQYKSQRHPKGRQHFGRLQPVSEDNMSSVFFIFLLSHE